jgi:hypothetical protein
MDSGANEPERGNDAEIPVRPLTFEEFFDALPETDEYKRYIKSGGQNPPEGLIPAGTPMNTMRERLAARGRLDRFEAEAARRRRERALNPQVLTDDVYRARQRLAAQRVLDQYVGFNIPKLTGVEHSNPTMEAAGGKIGMMVKLPQRPIARNPSGTFEVVNTDKEVRDNTPL